MLKKYILCLLLGFLNFNVHAQNFGGGFILGLNSSQVGGDDLAGFHKPGLLIGIFANKSISKLVSFQMEMIYTQKGSNNPDMNDYTHQNGGIADISLSYIEIPLLLQYHQSEDLQIEAGLLGAYLIDGYYNDEDGKMEYNNAPFINYDLGLLIGIEYKYSENISLNTRLSNSILPIGKEDSINQNTCNSFYCKGKYNSVLSFALHYNLL